MKKILLILLFIPILLKAQFPAPDSIYDVNGNIRYLQSGDAATKFQSIFNTLVAYANDTLTKADTLQYYTLTTALINKLNSLDSLIFNSQTVLTHQQGKIFYDSTEYGFVVYNQFSEVSGNVMYELWLIARNTSGSTITNGTPVSHAGSATGQLANVIPSGISTHDSSRVIAVATMDIPNNEIGIFTIQGKVRGLNLSAFTDGAELYAYYGGGKTDVKPSYPLFATSIGRVEYSHVNQGILYVVIQEMFDNHAIQSILFENGNGRTASDSANFRYDNSTKTARIKNINSDSIVVAELSSDGATYYSVDELVGDGNSLTAAQINDSITFERELINNDTIDFTYSNTNYNYFIAPTGKLVATGSKEGGGAMAVIVGNGTSYPDLTDFDTIGFVFNNNDSIGNWCTFWYQQGRYAMNIWLQDTFLLAYTDTARPVFTELYISAPDSNIIYAVANELLDAASVPDTSAIYLASTQACQDTLITISNDTMRVYCECNWTVDDTVVMTYTVPVSNQISDTAGNQMLAFTDTVTNNLTVSTLNDSLLVWWPMNGNLNDSTGNGFTLVNAGGAALTTDKNGAANKAYNFSRTANDYMTCDALADTLSTVDRYTISVWFTVTAFGVTNQQLFTASNDEALAEYIIHYVRNTPQEFRSTDTNLGSTETHTYESDGTLTTATWYHLVIEYNPTDGYSYYLNGSPWAGAYTTNTGDNVSYGDLNGTVDFVRLGSLFLSSSNSQYFDGKMDNFRFYSRNLTSAEITALWTEDF